MSHSRTDARGQATAYKPQKNARIPQKSMQRMPSHHQDITMTLLANAKHSQRALAASQAKKALEKAMMFSTPEPIDTAPVKDTTGGPRDLHVTKPLAIAPTPVADPESAAAATAAPSAAAAATAAAGPAATADVVLDSPSPPTTINAIADDTIPTNITPGVMTVTPGSSDLSKAAQEQSKAVTKRPNPPLWAKAVLVACTAPLVLPALGLVGAYVTGRVVVGTVRAFWGPKGTVC